MDTTIHTNLHTDPRFTEVRAKVAWNSSRSIEDGAMDEGVKNFSNHK